MIKFLRAYVKSMRLYYSFITGVAGWIGVAYYQYVAETRGAAAAPGLRSSVETPTPPEKLLVLLVILFMAWGINQIINDYLGRKADMINAPDRPMVSGELDPHKAILLSLALITLTFAVTALYLQPVAILPLAAGVLLNVLYEWAKGHGIWGNLTFGLMIGMCSLFGYYASGPTEGLFTRATLSVFLLIVVLNGVMTFYTYFKDVEGDRAAGKRTLIVKYGVYFARWLAIFSAFLPSLCFLVVYYLLGAIPIDLNRVFIILGLLTLFLQVWTGVLYFKHPVGEGTYQSLEVNFRAGACGQATLIALFNPQLGMMLFMFAYIFIGFLFSMHSNAKA